MYLYPYQGWICIFICSNWWYSKAVLAWRISNTMDTDLVMRVLNEVLSLYPKPEIFNTVKVNTNISIQIH